LLSDGAPFPSRYQLVFIAAGVIVFSLLCGVIALPLLLRGIVVSDKALHRKEERMARAVAAEVAIESLHKMHERLANDPQENIDDQLLSEVSSRVMGILRRRVDGKNEQGNALLIENIERRMRLNALRAERGEYYHLRAQQKISNETLQKLLHDLDLLEALLIDSE
jgi:CPA1 family monovalent cation:H+ antiporter